MLDFNEPVRMIDMALNDHSSFDYALIEGSVLDGVTVDSLIALLRTSPMLLMRVI